MWLLVHVSLRTKLLLDLEAQARLSRGQSAERCRPARLVEKAVEKAYGRRWKGRLRFSILRSEEERRLRAGREALGLTPRRLELLVRSLKCQAFRMGELGRLSGLVGAQPAGVALRIFHARGLIRLQRLGPSHMSLWRAERGAELERWLRGEVRSRRAPGSRRS